MMKRTVMCVAALLATLACAAGARADAFSSGVSDDAPGAAPLAMSPQLTTGAGVVPLLADNAVAGPSAAEATTQPALQPQSGSQRTVAEFIGHFSAYEPIYFIAGGGGHDPLVKFQFSFKYRFFNPDSSLAKQIPFLAGINFAYTQQSLWELNQSSAPFYDTNYMPEAFYSNEDIKLHIPGVSQLGFQGGYGHDSNGQGGSTSRGVNILFIRPIVTFGDPEGFHFYIEPKGYIYIGQLYGNGDIADYRGYCDLRGVVGWRQGLEFSFLGRLGRKADRGSMQLDFTYPLRDILAGNLDLYLDAQYFNGYGESLLEYNQHSQVFRVGLALAR